MIPVYVACSACQGTCHVAVFIGGFWDSRRCARCDGLGRQWAPGAPAYGCVETLADRDPGEIVTLGTGQRAKILWHMPRKAKKVKPDATFLGLIGEFDVESDMPIGYPSAVGVRSVEFSRRTNNHDAHGGERAEDYSDPLQGHAAGRLI